MKKISLLILFLAFSLLQSCAVSIIKVKTNNDPNAVTMFGNNSARNFYVPETVSDSLILKWENGTNGGFSNSSVVVSDTLVFIGDLSGRLYVFNSNNGKELGRLKDKGAIIAAPIISRFLIIYAVTLLDEKESLLYFYDFLDGKLYQTIRVPGKITNELLKTDDGYVVVTDEGMIFKYNSNGKDTWKYNSNSFVHCSPAYLNGKVIVGNESGELICLNDNDGSLIYKKEIGGHFTGGATIREGNIYIGNDNGIIYSFDLNSGKQNWKFDTGFRILMTPAADYENLYIGNLNGDLFSLDLQNGREKWKLHTSGVLNATPLITNNYLFVPDLDYRLHIVVKSNGKQDKTIEFDGRIKLTPVLHNDILYIGYDRGNLQAYEFYK